TVPAPRPAVGREPSRCRVGISPPGQQDSPMVTCWDDLYLDVMISADMTTRRAPAVIRALWSAPTRRATGNTLAALLAAVAATLLLGLVGVVWWAAGWSLLHWPVGGWSHAALYIATVLAGPVALLWVVQALTALQRSRLHATLGLDLPAGTRAAALKPWPVGPWRAASTWHQLGFHVLTVFTGLIGGGLAIGLWLAPVALIYYLAGGHPVPGAACASAVATAALVLAAPWCARLVTRVDEVTAVALLGPSRSEALELRVETLSRSRADIVKATDAERRRIERDLHDGTQQRLVSLAMNLGMARARLTGAPPDARQAKIGRASCRER